MKKNFSTAWKSSSQPRKQRKYIHNLAVHHKSKLMGAHLSPELRKQTGKRSLPVKTSDTVKVMTGSFRGTLGKVTRVNTKIFAAYVEGVERNRKDGTKVFMPIKASNLMITELNLEDKRRIKNGKKSP